MCERGVPADLEEDSCAFDRRREAGTYFCWWPLDEKSPTQGEGGVGLGKGEGREEAWNSRRVSRPVLLADGFLDFLFEFLDRMIAGEFAKELAVVEEQHLRNALQ